MTRAIAERIVGLLEPESERRRVADVRIGLGYTAVQLDDGVAGTAYTFRDEVPGGCSVFMGKRPLAGRPADELLPSLLSSNPLEAAVGLAAANALINRPHPDFFPGDILEVMNLRPSDRVGMVGYFAPVIPDLKKRVGELLIFERAARPQAGILPADEALNRLPECDAALLTSTALINHTMDDLLTAAKNCREVILLGASTPLCPAVFDRTPVTLLSGILIDSPAELLRVVSEGGGMPLFKGLVRKMNCRVRNTGSED